MPFLPGHGWEKEEGWAVGFHTGSGRGLQHRKTKAFRDSSKELLCERGNLGGVMEFTLLERDEGLL